MAQSVLLNRLHDRLHRPFSRRHRTARILDELYTRDAQQAFDDEAQPRGRAWPPLSLAYEARKQGPSILIETGRLHDSLTNVRGSEHEFRTKGGRLFIGSKVPYAGYATETRPVTPADFAHYASILGWALTATISRRNKALPGSARNRFSPRSRGNQLVVSNAFDLR